MELMRGGARHAHDVLFSILPRHEANAARVVPPLPERDGPESLQGLGAGCLLRDKLVQPQQQIVIFGRDLAIKELHNLVLGQTARKKAVRPRRAAAGRSAGQQ